jgi:hypothetical protein
MLLERFLLSSSTVAVETPQLCGMESGHVFRSGEKRCFDTSAWAILFGFARCHSSHTAARAQSTEDLIRSRCMSFVFLVIRLWIDDRFKLELSLLLGVRRDNKTWSQNNIITYTAECYVPVEVTLKIWQYVQPFVEAMCCVPRKILLALYVYYVWKFIEY